MGGQLVDSGDRDHDEPGGETNNGESAETTVTRRHRAELGGQRHVRAHRDTGGDGREAGQSGVNRSEGSTLAWDADERHGGEDRPSKCDRYPGTLPPIPMSCVSSLDTDGT